MSSFFSTCTRTTTPSRFPTILANTVNIFSACSISMVSPRLLKRMLKADGAERKEAIVCR